MISLKDLWLELLRLVALAIVSFLLTDGVLVQVLGANLSPELRMQLIALLTFALKGVDRWLHESGKAEKGLTRF